MISYANLFEFAFIGELFLIARRAHLLTTRYAGGGMPSAPCALRGETWLLRQPGCTRGR